MEGAGVSPRHIIGMSGEGLHGAVALVETSSRRQIVAIGLGNPVADRLGRGLELP